MLKELLVDGLKEIVPLVAGAIFTGLGWVVKAVIKAKHDLDIAHEKIRRLENRADFLEKTIYSEDNDASYHRNSRPDSSANGNDAS